MPLSDWVRKFFRQEAERKRSSARRPNDFVQLRVRRMEERRVFSVSAVTAPADAAVNEGAIFTLSASTYKDATTVSGPHTAQVNWGDGTAVQSLSVTEPAALGADGTVGGLTHTFANNPPGGTYTVTVTVFGNDGSQASDTLFVTVNNVAPTPNAGGPYFVGSSGTVQLSGSATDPGTLDTLTYSWDLDGDGVFGETGGGAARGNENVQNPIFNGAAMPRGTPETITLRVGDGTTTTDTTTTVTRNNLPTISAIADIDTPKGVAPGAINFTIGDTETAAGSLTLSASSSNSSVVNNVAGSFTFGGSGANRTLTLTPVANAVGTTTITITVTDAAGESSQETFLVRFNAPPAVTPTVADLTYTEGVGAVILDGGVTLSDADPGTMITEAIISVTVFDGAAEQLAYVDNSTPGITGVYGGGTLTLSGTATLAAYQAAIRSVTYQNSSVNPTTTDRTIGISVNDGLNTSNIGTRTLKVSRVNSSPVLNGANDLTAINEDQSNATNPGTLVSALIAGQITDADGAGALQGIAVTGLVSTNGTWQYTINGGTNWLALAGAAPGTARLLAADAQTKVRFIPSANINGLAVGTITFQAWDQTSGANGGTADATSGGGATAFSTASFSSAIDVSPVNDPPTVTTTIGATSYTEGSTGVVVDAGVSLADIDDTIIESAEVIITNYVAGEDSLVYVNGTVAGITGGFSAGKLTLTGDGTVNAAAFITALQSVKYHNTSTNPTTTARVISFSVNDGDADTAAPLPTKTVSITAVNNAPALSGANDFTQINEDQTNATNPGTLVSALISGRITDDDGPSALTGIAVTSLTTAKGTWQYTIDGGTNWLALTGVSTGAARLLAADALTKIRFIPNTNINGLAVDSITFQAWDRTSNSNGGTADVSVPGGSSAFSTASFASAIDVNPVNDPPVVTTTGGATTYTEGLGGVVVDSGVSIIDIDDSIIESAEVIITNFVAGQDNLVYVNGTVAGITGSFSAGKLTLTGDGSVSTAAFITALQSVKYDNSSNTPTTTARVISFSVNDGDADTVAPLPTKTVDIVEVNTRPSMTTSNGVPNVDEDITNVANTGTLVSAIISGHFTDNDGPLQGIAVTAASNAFGDWQYALDGTTWVTFSGLSASNARLLAADATTRIRFVPDPNYSGPAGAMQFRAWDGFTGTAGGVGDVNSTTAFGAAIVSIGPTVNPVNDAPTLTGANNLMGIAENVSDGANTGTLVSALISGRVSDQESNPIGIAVTAVDNTRGTWQYTVDGGTNWIDFGSPSATAAVLLTANAQTKVRFVPIPEYNGTVTNGLTFRAWDQTSGAAGGTADVTTNGTPTAFSTGQFSSSITVTGTNDAPTITPTATNVDFDKGGPAIVIDPTIVVFDPDSDTLSSATIILTNRKANDVLAISGTLPSGITSNIVTDTTAGTITITLTGVSSVANYQAALRMITYRNTDPTPNGEVRVVTFRVNDGALNSSTTTYNIDVNKIPVLSMSSTADLSYTEGDANLAIASGVGILDNDDGNMQSATIKITLPSPGSTEDELLFTNQTGVTGAVTSDATHLILTFTGPGTKANFAAAINSIRYRNQSQNPNTTDRTITFVVNDSQANSNVITRTLNVAAVNDAPVLTAANNFTSIPEDVTSGANTGTLVSALISGQVTDADGAGALTGIAVVGAATTNGSWEYTVDGGSNWLSLGSPTAATARLLAADALTRIRFVPNANYNGTATITIRAWDQTGTTAGQAGTSFNITASGNATPFSSATANATITVTAVNDAPTIASANDLTAIDEDATTNVTNPGTLVSALLAGQIADIDGPGAGIAVTGVDNTNGTWQYSTNGGTNWLALAGVSSANARLLAGTALVRFVPNANFNGTVTGGLSFKAWDQLVGSGTSGNTADTTIGGMTAFSSTIVSSSITVNAVNDAPVLSGTQNLAPITEDILDAANLGTLVSALVAGRITDVDGPAVGIAVTGVNNTNGTWQYTVDGTTWTDFGSPGTATSRLLSADALTRVRFVPNADFTGTVSGLTYRAWDGFSGTAGNTADTTSTGNATPFSTASFTATIGVVGVNDPPRISNLGAGITFNENALGQTLSSTVTVADPDNDQIKEMTITIVGNPDANDRLLFNNVNAWGITGSFANGVLTLTGTTSAVNYTAALRSITFFNASDDPVAGVRTISFSGRDANDADTLAPLPSKTVTVVASNDAPTFSAPPAAIVPSPQNRPTDPIAFTIDDLDDAESTLTLTGSSSNQAMVQDGNIVFGGSGANRTVTITPETGAAGDVSITLTVTDSSGASSQYTFTLRLNDPPQIVTAPVGTTVVEDTAFVETRLRVSDTETPLASLDVTATSSNPSVILDAGISVTLDTATGEHVIRTNIVPNWSGTAVITVTVRDGGGSIVTAQYTIVVTAVNDAPVIPGGQTRTTKEDEAILDGQLLASDGDPDFTQTLTYILAGGPLAGTVVIDSTTGTFVYTPRANWSGTDQFAFYVLDDNSAGGAALFSLGFVTIDVTGVADTPVIVGGGSIVGDENKGFFHNLNIQTDDRDGSEAITRVMIEHVHHDIRFQFADGTIVAPDAVNLLTGRKTYDMDWGKFMSVSIYAPDNFAAGVDTSFKITATSTDFTAPAGLDRTRESIFNVPVLVRNVAPDISGLFGTNVDSNASTSLTALLNDAPRDTMSIIIQWGRSTTGFPQTTALAGIAPGSSIFQQFTFLVAPNPADPSAPIEIIVTAIDKDGGAATRTVTIAVPGTGIPTPIVRDLGFIDPPSLLRNYSVSETQDIRTTIPTAPSSLNDRRAVTQQVTTTQRSVELRKVTTRGEDDPTVYRLPLTVLDDLPNFLQALPDGHYRLYLRETELTAPRMLADVVIFRGRAVSPGDLQADRPPREFRTPSSETPELPPVAKTPGPLETSSQDVDGPRLRGPGLREPTLREPNLREPGFDEPELRVPSPPPVSTPELQELRGSVP
jgi:hypothetical protein